MAIEHRDDSIDHLDLRGLSRHEVETLRTVFASALNDKRFARVFVAQALEIAARDSRIWRALRAGLKRPRPASPELHVWEHFTLYADYCEALEKVSSLEAARALLAANAGVAEETMRDHIKRAKKALPTLAWPTGKKSLKKKGPGN